MIEHVACQTSPIKIGGNPLETIWLLAKVIFYPKMPHNPFSHGQR
jgi:hypothetical protein